MDHAEIAASHELDVQDFPSTGSVCCPFDGTITACIEAVTRPRSGRDDVCVDRGNGNESAEDVFGEHDEEQRTG